MKQIIDCFDGEYRFLSNFAPIPVFYDGIECRTSESAFQMMKTLDLDLRRKIGKSHPSQAKRAGRHVPLRPDWEQVKDQVMYEIVLAKFSQNEDAKKALLDTKDAMLIEGNDWNDTYWGVCNGVGKNTLGQILMRVRKELGGE